MKLVLTIILCVCSFISAQCDEGEVELWPDYPSGLYILSMKSNNFSHSQKISLTK